MEDDKEKCATQSEMDHLISQKNSLSTSRQLLHMYDFALPVPNFTDVALVVGGKRLFVGKRHLSNFSPVFYSLFFPDSGENVSEIQLEGIVLDEFLELLHVVYAHRTVTSENVECLLKLANRCAMQFVLRACVDFLCGPESRQIPLTKKLRMLDLYYVDGVKNFCLIAINTANEGKAVVATYEYEEFSHLTKCVLLERIIQLG